MRREGNGGLYRWLSGRHPFPASISSGLAGILEKCTAGVGSCGRRALGGHIRRRWEMHHAGSDALAESAHARLLSGPEFTCQSAGRHAGRCNKLFGFHVGKCNFIHLFLTVFNISLLRCSIFIMYFVVIMSFVVLQIVNNYDNLFICIKFQINYIY